MDPNLFLPIAHDDRTPNLVICGSPEGGAALIASLLDNPTFAAEVLDPLPAHPRDRREQTRMLSLATLRDLDPLDGRFDAGTRIAAVPPPLPTDLIGQVVGFRYRLARPIGRGALNEVWEAAELAFGETIGQVAVKLQPPTGPRRAAHFVREAKMMATLKCPHFVPYRSSGVQSDGQLAGWAYIAAGLASTSLRAAAAESVLAGDDLKQMVVDIATGLAYLHSQDLVHGDVKPANILRYGGRWVLSDFGLVQGAGPAQPEGTIGYMAPERFSGLNSTKSDVYSLGVTLYAALSGEARIEVSTLADPTIERIWNAIEEAPDPPDVSRLRVPTTVRRLLERVLEPNVRQRISSSDLVQQAGVIPPTDFRPGSVVRSDGRTGVHSRVEAGLRSGGVAGVSNLILRAW
jgi:serine/threonine-protein kinase